jgi:hypothetical protein
VTTKANFIVTNENGRVRTRWSKSACEAHQGIIDLFSQPAEPGCRQTSFVRVVMTSPDEDFGESLDAWSFGVAQETVPDWFDAVEIEKAVRKELPHWHETKIVGPGQVRKRIDGNQHVVAVLGEVDEVCDSATIEHVCGSGHIRYVDGSAKIENVHDSATIDNIHGSARVGCIYDSATAKFIYGTSIIEHVSGSATIKSIYGSATIFYAHGSARIEHMHGSARIGCIYGSANVGYLYGAATVESIYGMATIGAVYGTATIESLQGSAAIGQIDGPAQAIYYTKPDLSVLQNPDAVIIDRSGAKVNTFVGVQA